MGVFKATFLTHPGMAQLRHAETDIELGSALTTLLAFLSLLPLAWGHQPNPVCLLVSTGTLLLTIWYPNAFNYLILFWRSLTLGLGSIGIIIFWALYILPTGLIMQARGIDPLRLRFQPKAKTYWQQPAAPTNMERPM